MDRDGGSLLADMDPQFYSVVVKALLVHSAQWNGNDELLKEICGPADKRRHVERSENSCRFIGFGVPDVAKVLECAPNRATLVGFGTIRPETAHSFRIPLPECLERVTDPRSLTVTVAWFSPIKPGHQSYRCVRLEAAPLSAIEELGVERRKTQPADPSVKRGSVFHEHFHGQSAVPLLIAVISPCAFGARKMPAWTKGSRCVMALPLRLPQKPRFRFTLRYKSDCVSDLRFGKLTLLSNTSLRTFFTRLAGPTNTTRIRR